MHKGSTLTQTELSGTGFLLLSLGTPVFTLLSVFLAEIAAVDMVCITWELFLRDVERVQYLLLRLMEQQHYLYLHSLKSGNRLASPVFVVAKLRRLRGCGYIVVVLVLLSGHLGWARVDFLDYLRIHCGQQYSFNTPNNHVFLEFKKKKWKKVSI